MYSILCKKYCKNCCYLYINTIRTVLMRMSKKFQTQKLMYKSIGWSLFIKLFAFI